MVWRCGRCGRSEPDGHGGYRDRACGRCGGALRFEEAAEVGWKCPRCGRSLRGDATRCEGCAQGYAREERGTAVAAAQCPACRVDLAERTVADVSVLGCGVCHGLMVSHELMREWTRERASAAPEGIEEEVVFEHDWQVHYRRCPRCVVLMNRANFAPSTGVIVDVCPTHGYWLDAGELVRIVAYVRARGIEATVLARGDDRKREVDRARTSLPPEFTALSAEDRRESSAERLGRLLLSIFLGVD